MADLQRVIGLLYRADWTRLSLSAEVHTENDGDLALSRLRATRPPKWQDMHVRRFRPGPDGDLDGEEVPEEELGGYHTGRATLLIAPGGRYRQEDGDEPSRQVQGSDGERGWIWHLSDLEPSLWFPFEADHAPPFPELFCPSDLLGGFTLQVRGPATACGRDAIAVVATPRADIGHLRWPGSVLFDRLEAIVDADLGIVLRREETFGGQRLSLTELTAVVLDPPEAADRSRFEPPPGSRISQGIGESLRQMSRGPGWEAAKNAAGLAAGGLGAWIRFAPRRSGRDDNLEAAMPPAEPPAHELEDRTPAARSPMSARSCRARPDARYAPPSMSSGGRATPCPPPGASWTISAAETGRASNRPATGAGRPAHLHLHSPAPDGTSRCQGAERPDDPRSLRNCSMILLACSRLTPMVAQSGQVGYLR